MIIYSESTDGISPDMLRGFFRHWRPQPSAEALLRILKGSDHIVLAVDTEIGTVAGYITAITDRVSCAYIPHLEVREELEGRGIGSELVRLMVEKLSQHYMIDLMCDTDLQPFYARLGFRASTGMIIRNRARQTCETED